MINDYDEFDCGVNKHQVAAVKIYRLQMNRIQLRSKVESVVAVVVVFAVSIQARIIIGFIIHITNTINRMN